MKVQKVFQGVAIGAVLLGLGACGSGNGQDAEQMVKSVQLRSYQQNSDYYVEVSTMVDTGNTQLMAFELPIWNPKDPSLVYGKLAVRPAFVTGATTQQAEIAIGVNITDVANLNFVDGKLPNGTPVPVSGLGNTPVIGIPIGHSGARVYVAYGSGVALLGVAVPIKEMDGLGNQVGGSVNIFPSFDMGEGVRGVAGIFAGTEQNQNGLAFFVDAGKAISDLQPADELRLAKVSSKAAASAAPASTLRFSNGGGKRRDVYAVQYGMYKLNKKRAKLHMKVQ